MKIRLFPAMAFALFAASVHAQVPAIGVVVDGTTLTLDDPYGTNYLSYDAAAGYHLSGSVAFNNFSLSYDLVMNGGPSATPDVIVWYRAPLSWYQNIDTWCNNSAARFYGLPFGSVDGQVTLGNAPGQGAPVGDSWHFTNQFGGQDTFEQHLPFTSPQQQTLGVNLAVDKPIGLVVEARGWSGIKQLPEPSGFAAVAGALLTALVRRRAIARVGRSNLLAGPG